MAKGLAINSGLMAGVSNYVQENIKDILLSKGYDVKKVKVEAGPARMGREEYRVLQVYVLYKETRFSFPREINKKFWSQTELECFFKEL